MRWPDDFVNKVICGDCLEVMKHIPNKSVDLVLTDPPYGVIGKTFNWDDIDVEEFTENWFNQVKTKTRGGFITFWSQKYIPLGFKIFNPDRMLIWHHPNLAKPTSKMYLWTYDPIFYIKGQVFNGKFTRGLNTDVKKYAKPQSNYKNDKRFHETQKPLRLVMDLIEVNTNEGDLVLDPFLGSGTTAVACKQLGRKFIGIEINPEYCEIAKERLREGVFQWKN